MRSRTTLRIASVRVSVSLPWAHGLHFILYIRTMVLPESDSDACLSFAGSPRPTLAQTLDATRVQVPLPLDSQWRMHAGDDPRLVAGGFGRLQLDYVRSQSKPLELSCFGGTARHCLVSTAHPGASFADTSGDQENRVGESIRDVCERPAHSSQCTITPYRPYTFDSKLIAPISAREAATGSIVLALRTVIAPEEWRNTTPSLTADNLTQGQLSTLQDLILLDVIGQNIGMYLISDEQEIDTPGALPLRIAPDQSYELVCFGSNRVAG